MEPTCLTLTFPVSHPVYLNPVRKRKIGAEQILSHVCWVSHLWSLKQACTFKDSLPICITCDVKLNGQSVGPWNVQEDTQPEWITSHQHEVQKESLSNRVPWAAFQPHDMASGSTTWSAIVLQLLLLWTMGFCKPGTSTHPEQIAEADLTFVSEELIALSRVLWFRLDSIVIIQGEKEELCTSIFM